MEYLHGGPLAPMMPLLLTIEALRRVGGPADGVPPGLAMSEERCFSMCV